MNGQFDGPMVLYTFLIVLSFICLIIILIINMKQKARYQTNFYSYKVKYDDKLEKYYKMIRMQRAVLFKKQVQLLLLNILIKLKGK